VTPEDFELKANIALDSAKLLLSAGDNSGACNRAYYAVFNATRAALVRLDVKLIEVRTHKGLISAFNKHLIKDGTIACEIGHLISDIKEARNLADYIEVEMPKYIAERAIMQADEFLSALSPSKISFKIAESDIPVCSYCGQVCGGGCGGGMNP
jgi:uncharacterized protein (UPF0332 family)